MSNRSVIQNLPGTDLVLSPHKFLGALSRWATSPSSQYLWVVRFESNTPLNGIPGNSLGPFPRLLANQASNGIHSYESTNVAFGSRESADSGNEWNVWRDNNYFATDDFANNVHQGCMIIQGINIPGEQASVGYTGVKSRGGIIPVLHSNERLEPQELTMSAYEGNISFVDTVIRPWIILGSHFGQVARDQASNLKCNIIITQFAKTIGREVTDEIVGDGKSASKPPTIKPQENTLIQRKQFKFYNAVPTRMDASDLTYAPDQGLLVRNITWAYTHYTLMNGAGSNYQKGSTAQNISDVLDTWYNGTGGSGDHWRNITDKFQSKAKGHAAKFLKMVPRKMKHHHHRPIDRIITYGPKGPGHPGRFADPGAKFETRWRAVKVRNLCMEKGRGDQCKPPPPPPGSALDKIRSSLRNLTKLARNARGFAASFKNIGKAKGVKGKVNALGDLNKSFGKMSGGSAKSGGTHKTLGGGMPKAKSANTRGGHIGNAGSVIDDAKKAARAVAGGSRSKGGE